MSLNYKDTILKMINVYKVSNILKLNKNAKYEKDTIRYFICLLIFFISVFLFSLMNKFKYLTINDKVSENIKSKISN